MTANLKLHELTGSPNSVKVRIALGYKKLPYEREALDLRGGYPGDRSKLVALSGQPLAPVLQHGETIVFDSSAILRYLDANFRKTPQLYSADHAEMQAIEGWEMWVKTKLGEPVGMIFEQAASDGADRAACQRASALVNDVTGRIEDQLATRPYLVRSTPSAADVTAAPFVNLAMLPPLDAKTNPIGAFFHANFSLGDGRDRTREWVRKMMAYDEAR